MTTSSPHRLQHRPNRTRTTSSALSSRKHGARTRTQQPNLIPRIPPPLHPPPHPSPTPHPHRPKTVTPKHPVPSLPCQPQHMPICRKSTASGIACWALAQAAPSDSFGHAQKKAVLSMPSRSFDHAAVANQSENTRRKSVLNSVSAHA